MGMTCSLHRATPDQLARLAREPDLLREVLGFDAFAPDVVEVRPKGVLGMILRMLPITITEAAPAPTRDAAMPAMRDDRILDIEKAWHGLHYLMTGTVEGGEEPACFLLRGGDPLDDEGVARALHASDVSRFAELLDALSPDELERRYDPARMTQLDIYPSRIWQAPHPDGESPLRWLITCYIDLRVFMAGAAEAGDAVIVHLA
jgi:hypothetical protein